MLKELPTFRYHLDPIATNVIVPSEAVCPICNKATGYVYQGPSFSFEDIENICPWCLHNGDAASKHDIEFVDEEWLEPVNDPSRKEELLRRTPGYFCGTIYEWHTHCGDFCTLIGKVEWKDILKLESELATDIDRLIARDEIDREEMEDAISRGVLWAYLFRCQSCGKHRLSASYE